MSWRDIQRTDFGGLTATFVSDRDPALSSVRLEEVRSSNLLSSAKFKAPVQAASWKLCFPAAIAARDQERSEVAGMRLGPPMAGIDVGDGQLRYPVLQAVRDVR